MYGVNLFPLECLKHKDGRCGSSVCESMSMITIKLSGYRRQYDSYLTNDLERSKLTCTHALLVRSRVRWRYQISSLGGHVTVSIKVL